MKSNSWEKIFAILTVCFTLLFLLMLGVDAFLKEVLDVSQKNRDWIAGPGVVGFLGALFSAWAWRSEVKVKRRVQKHEEKMRADERAEEQAKMQADEKLRIMEAAHARREEQERIRIESLLRRDVVRDEINYMSGVEFERFMADVFRQKGYGVETTKASGDQGVDLLLDIEDKKIAVQLKRWTGPVGNAVVGATFAGIAHYEADEGWIITTSTFTRSARELARSTRVRLIDGKELGDWLEGLREQE
jgi:HJR/Mrr/RecB family endonuclease